MNWRKHEEIWDNLISLSLGLADLEKYLMPPNEADVLVSSYLKMNPRILNFCSFFNEFAWSLATVLASCKANGLNRILMIMIEIIFNE